MNRWERAHAWEHLAVRGTTPTDRRVLYACGDALAYTNGRGHDTTENGARAVSHTFETHKPVRCPKCEAARTRGTR